MFGLEKLGSLGQGANDTPPAILSKEEVERRRKLAQALMMQGSDTAPVQHWLQGAARIGQALQGAVEDYQTTKAEDAAQAEGKRLSASLFGGGQTASLAPPATPPAGQGVATPPGNIPQRAAGPQGGDVATSFLSTLRDNGLNNPNALAAVGATGHHESRWAPDKLNATWSDPSQSGQPGTSGGALSWRADRLQRLQQFAAANGEQGNGSAATQARFFLQEDPALVQKLNAAQTPEEAMTLMNNAWRYANFDKPGGETAARMASAQAWAARNPLANTAPMQAGAPTQTGGVQQVAQALTGQTPAVPQRSLPELMAIANSPAFDRMPKGSQDLVKALIQKQVTAETKDPRDGMLKDLTIEEKRRALARTEMETFTDPATGALFQRPKGSTDAPTRVQGLGDKPADPKFREFNGRLYQEGRDGSLIDKTPQGGPSSYRPMTPDERKQFNVPEGTPAFLGPDGKPTFGPASRTEQGEFGKAADKKMVEYFGTHAEGGNAANAVLQGMDILREVAGMAPQGGITGRLANAFPGFNTAADVFNSQVKTLAPQLRVPGSGATSDKDLDTFMAALPNLKNTPEANQAVLGIVEAKAKLNLQRSEIARRALRREIDQNEADKQLRELDRQSILTPEARKALGLGNKTETGKAAGGPRILSVEPIR